MKQFKANYIHEGSVRSILLGVENINEALQHALALKDNVIKVEEILEGNNQYDVTIESFKLIKQEQENTYEH